MTTLLTTEQVADLAGIHRTYVGRWAARHRIPRTSRRTSVSRRYYYPAAVVQAAVAARRPSASVVAAAGLHRFICNPLNWTV